MQEIIERLISLDRFSMNELYNHVWGIFSDDEVIVDSAITLKENLGNKKYKQLACGILRHAFLIELVKVPGIETTKFRTRWYSQLGEDPRQCSFEEW